MPGRQTTMFERMQKNGGYLAGPQHALLGDSGRDGILADDSMKAPAPGYRPADNPGMSCGTCMFGKSTSTEDMEGMGLQKPPAPPMPGGPPPMPNPQAGPPPGGSFGGPMPPPLQGGPPMPPQGGGGPPQMQPPGGGPPMPGMGDDGGEQQGDPVWCQRYGFQADTTMTCDGYKPMGGMQPPGGPGGGPPMGA